MAAKRRAANFVTTPRGDTYLVDKSWPKHLDVSYEFLLAHHGHELAVTWAPAKTPIPERFTMYAKNGYAEYLVTGRSPRFPGTWEAERVEWVGPLFSVEVDELMDDSNRSRVVEWNQTRKKL